MYSIVRYKSTDQGTFGKLLDPNNALVCYTGELPWRDNQHGVSCIPAGIYHVIPHNSPKHPNTWELMGVPGRSDVLLHNGNIPSIDSQGCILVGDGVSMINGHEAVINSIITLHVLRTKLPINFDIVVKNAY